MTIYSCMRNNRVDNGRRRTPGIRHLQEKYMAPSGCDLSGGINIMKNGLYSIHIQMLDGVKGWSSGVIILHDGRLIGGDPYFWTVGTYTCKEATWKGELVTNQHTPYRDSAARPVFAGREVTTGFSGTYRGGESEVFGTSLVGSRSISFRATLRWLAD
ncbi:GrlR family regulatory protein [Bradyrhizobium sp. URHD0069]|uniref:GrlR family regulatory protein n=1 Tax=Bradyrhizobium sp. URHD0069 TaxID=1380355 RepID=UPI001FDA3B3B|nr:GrlR family regulatory protein [Bradyrhizobium sp. URHD0069]